MGHPLLLRTMDHTKAVSALESLGNETRLNLFRILVRAGNTGMPVGKLRERLAIPGSTLSHHLSQLVSAGLISQTREGRMLRCQADFAVMRDLLAYLTEECCADEDSAC